MYVCLGALKQGFRAHGREILGLDGCFMSGPWPCQILTGFGVDANNGIYPVAYAIVEAESKASWCWFLNLPREDLGIEANFNYTFFYDRQKTEGVGPVGKFKEVEVDADNELEEESDTEGDYTSGSDSEDLDYDPKHDDVFDDDEHIVKEVHVNMNNLSFTADPKHDTSIDGLDV
nr:transposase, mutator type [Tanacetum cinerariifolium]